MSLHQNLGLSEQQCRHRALDGWIRQAALHDRAVREGIVVTDSQVADYLAKQAAIRRQYLASNPTFTAQYQAFVLARGYSRPDDYDHDPRSIGGARLILEAAILDSAHLPAGATTGERDSFIAETIALAKVTVNVTIG